MRLRILRILSLLLFPMLAIAQSVEAPDGSKNKKDLGVEISAIQKPDERIRLSDFLIKTQPNQDAYLLGLSWRAASERESQAKLKDQLLASLAKLPPPKNDPSFETSRQALRDLIEKMPITGRVSLMNANARYLQIQPKMDPILEVGDQIEIPKTPNTITLIRTDGLICKVAHQPNVETRQYFKACRAQAVVADWAWIIEPDGRVRKVSTADWNEASQNLPAPGSWIWAPPRSSIWAHSDSQQFNQLLTQFLATQDSSGQINTIDAAVHERTPPILSTADRYYSSRNLPLTTSLWGPIGLLQTPSARVAPAGTGSINFSLAKPYGEVNVFLNPYDFLEFGFTYTNVSNVPYGPQNVSGSQTAKDKSAAIKLRLWQESAYVPEIALGARDFVGTGAFGGEYLVFSKRASNLDFSLGLGWGYLGNRGNVTNPLTLFNSSYSTRPPNTNQTGGTLTGNYFKGPSAVFGGVQYHTPWDPLILKIELDGNNYQNEPYGNVLLSKTPINLGAVYRWGPLDFTVGLRQGTQVMFGLSLHERLDQLATSKIAEPRSLPVDLKTVGSYTPPSYLSLNTSPSSENLEVAKKPLAKAATTQLNTKTQNASGPLLDTKTDLQTTSQSGSTKQLGVLDRAPPTETTTVAKAERPYVLNSTQTLLEFQAQTGWNVNGLYNKDNRWIIDIDNATGVFLTDRMNKGIGVLHRDAPSNITEFTLQFYNWGLLVSTFQVDRMQWMLSQTQLLAPSKIKNPIGAIPVDLSTAQEGKELGKLSHSPWQGEFGMAYTQVLGGPNVPLLFALSAQGQGIYKLRDDAWLSSIINVRLVDNFGKFTYQSPTNLPPVRTDIRQYMTTSIATMPNLQATKTFQPANDHFASIYGGYLEMMFAGAGGEYLYRPTNSKFALGVDANRVYQRQFNQWTSLQNYSVNTGHITAYWDTGLENTLVKFSLGQYLAGDRGGTLDISRVFGNGVKMGAYVTRTNVNYSQYGEGSFDKGIYVGVPFDAFFGKHSESTANLLWTPIIRDGGAKLFRQYPLYEMTNSRDNRALITGPLVTGN